MAQQRITWFTLVRVPVAGRWLADNPVQAAEWRYIERTVPRRQRWVAWAMSAVVALGVLAVIAHGLADTLAPLIPRTTPAMLRDTLVEWTQLSAIGALVALVSHTALITNMAPRLAAATLSRERRSHTWEPLVLTGIAAGRIVWGKWAAVVALVLHRHRAGLWLRALCLAWGIFGLLIFDDSGVPWTVGPAIVGLALVVVLPPLLAGFFAALGMVASALARSETAALRVLLGLALLPLALFVCTLCALPVLFGPATLSEEVVGFMIGLFLPLIDTGLSSLLVAIALATAEPVSYTGQWAYLAGVAAHLVLLVLSTRGLLLLAATLSVRQGAIDAAAPRQLAL